MAARKTPSRGGKPDKLIRDALLISLNRKAEDGKSKKLQALADKLVAVALQGDVSAIKEVADRVDGKAHQAVSLEGELNITRVERVIIDPANPNAASLPPAA